MKFPLCVTHRRQTAFFRIVGLMLAITLWLMQSAANTYAYAQTSADVSSAAASTSSPADWTEFHRDNMQRWNLNETVLGVNNVGSLQLKWKSPVSPGSLGVSSSPAVVNGVVYIGSTDNNVYALNAGTGAKLWNYATGGFVFPSPAVSNGLVYFGSYDSNDYAVNASTGATVWISTPNGGDGEFVICSPTVVNGVMYVGDTFGTLFALNASTGAVLWGGGVGGTGVIEESSPAVSNGVVYVGLTDGQLEALNTSTGTVLWSYASGGSVESSPAVSNGVVYVGSGDHSVYALNASTGAKLWSYTTGSLVTSSPAVANGVVYIGSYDKNVYALNASTGAKLWSFATGAAVESSPAVANGVVYIGSDDDSVYALNASTGAKLWSYATGGPVTSSPTIVDGVLYVSAGNTYAFSVGADLFLRINPSTTTVHQGDLLTYAFPVWNLGPANADFEVLNTQVPAGTTFDYLRISGTPGLGTCTHPPYGGTGQIICHEGDGMAPNTTWTVRLTVKVTAPAGTVITANAATMADTADPNMVNNTATVNLTVQ